VLLPWSMWAMIQKLRICFIGCKNTDSIPY